ncbi:MAG: hypothetical protein HS122_00110 [Opitutaceae bacterium]|nr:hypothetical protein [Opitutaceae bacterium]
MSNKPSRRSNSNKSKRHSVHGILGVGLDNQDGHRRITTGEQFTLVGGSEKTHDQMTETMMKTFEELKRRDRRLENVDPRELAEILHKSTPE